jgi:hypothetical protein
MIYRINRNFDANNTNKSKDEGNKVDVRGSIKSENEKS